MTDSVKLACNLLVALLLAPPVATACIANSADSARLNKKQHNVSIKE
jgi:hypothetical protein